LLINRTTNHGENPDTEASNSHRSDSEEDDPDTEPPNRDPNLTGQRVRSKNSAVDAIADRLIAALKESEEREEQRAKDELAVGRGIEATLNGILQLLKNGGSDKPA